ncbi:MAG TPA: beta-galactosidase [Exilispira sp.]|nr:beta-galactosidase [Exilispira sp.]
MKKFMLGVDYYPEQWDKSQWEKDANKMAEAGFEAIRIMEFAWSLIEKEEGVFDFSLFDEVIEIFSRYKIRVVLGTPTATIPFWLYQKDNSILQITYDGKQKQFGGRRSCCVNNPTYIKHVKKLVEKIALHYGKNENVIGWQLDNEIGHEGSDFCYCENCKTKWNIWLKNKYKDIDNLNRIWGTNFWGTTYNDFNIPTPQNTYGSLQNPTLLIDYSRFMSDSNINFLNLQHQILKKFINNNQWISTDIFMPSLSSSIDFNQLTKEHDFIGLNNYPVWGEQNEPLPYYFVSLNFSYLKGLKDNKHFIVFEQMSGIQGHSCLGYLPKIEELKLWTNKSIIFGADKLFYFRYRTAMFGQEQLCYGLLNPDNLNSDNNETEIFKELTQNIKKNRNIFDRISSSKQKDSLACLIYDKDNVRLTRYQYHTKALYYKPVEYMQAGYELEFTRWYAPFSLFNISIDVKPYENVKLENYKIISLPLFFMVDEDFLSKLEKWVEDGGILILSWRTGIRDKNNVATTLKLPGKFSKICGIEIEKFESLNNTKTKIRAGLLKFEVEAWADIIETKGAKVIAKYSDKKKHYSGEPAITVNNFGKGKVYYFGTSLSPLGLLYFYYKIFKNAKLNPKFYGAGIESIDYIDENGKEFKVIINNTSKSKKAFGKKIKPFDFAIKE